MKMPMRDFSVPNMQEIFEHASTDMIVLLDKSTNMSEFAISKKHGEILHIDFCDVAIFGERVDCPNGFPFLVDITGTEEEGYKVRINGYDFEDGKWKFSFKRFAKYAVSLIRKGLVK